MDRNPYRAVEILMDKNKDQGNIDRNIDDHVNQKKIKKINKTKNDLQGVLMALSSIQNVASKATTN